MGFWEVVGTVAESVWDSLQKQAEHKRRQYEKIAERSERYSERYADLSKEQLTSEYRKIDREGKREKNLVEDVLYDRDDAIARKIALKRNYDED